MRYLYASLAAAMLAAATVPAVAGTLLVPQQFSTIQAAINAAKPYDTVLVSPKAKGGVYSEAVTISTPHVTLQGSGNPVLDGSTLTTVVIPFPTIPNFTENSSPNGIEIAADHVTVHGLTLQNFGVSSGYYVQTVSGIGIGFYSADGQTHYSAADVEISGNTLRHNAAGVIIDGSAGVNPVYGSGGTYLKGYRLLGNLVTGSTYSGVTLSGTSVLVSGNTLLSNGGRGLDVTGTGVTIIGNESGKNGDDGMDITDSVGTYNPAVVTPGSPNPAPTITTLNSIHDNLGSGLLLRGTQTVSGNSLVNNTGAGIVLEFADDSVISGNVISGTVNGYNGGVGILAEVSAALTPSGSYGGGDSKLTISFNQISGGAGDGIAFGATAGGTVSFNTVTGNQGVGIHLSDYSGDFGYYDFAPTTVTQNRALHNTAFDARDDTSAPDFLAESNGNFYVGDGASTINVWTKNVFGTTDPIGLSK